MSVSFAARTASLPPALLSRLNGSRESPLAAGRPPPAAHVLAGEIDHHVGGRRLVGCAPGDSAASAHVLRPPADDENLISALQQPLDERSSDKTGAAGDDDLHARGDYRAKNCAPPERGGASVLKTGRRSILSQRSSSRTAARAKGFSTPSEARSQPRRREVLSSLRTE